MAGAPRDSVPLQDDGIKVRRIRGSLRRGVARVPRRPRAVRRHDEGLWALTPRLRDHREPLPRRVEPFRCQSEAVGSRTEPFANRIASLGGPAAPLPSRRITVRWDPEALPHDAQPLGRDLEPLPREPQALRRRDRRVADRVRGGRRQLRGDRDRGRSLASSPRRKPSSALPSRNRRPPLRRSSLAHPGNAGVLAGLLHR